MSTMSEMASRVLTENVLAQSLCAMDRTAAAAAAAAGGGGGVGTGDSDSSEYSDAEEIAMADAVETVERWAAASAAPAAPATVAAPAAPAAPATVAVCIVTGTTGAGKSRVLSQLIRSMPPGARAVVVSHRHANAYGLETTRIDVADDVDSPVVLFGQVFDFGSGCVCCSPDGDLTRLLRRLDDDGSTTSAAAAAPDNNASSRNGSVVRRITHLFLETTGVADIRPFVRVFRRSAASYHIHSVVSVVNARATSRKWWVGGVDAATLARAREQLALSDVVVVYGESAVTAFTAAAGKGGNLAIVADSDLHDLLQQECPRAPVLPATSVSFESITSALLRRRSNDPYHQHSVGECPACVEEAETGTAIGSLASAWNPAPFSMQHDRTFSSACVEEVGGVLWSRCKPWLESLLAVAGSLKSTNCSSSSSSSSSSGGGSRSGSDSHSGSGSNSNTRPRVVYRIQGWLSVATESDGAAGGGAVPQRQTMERFLLVDGVVGEPLRLETVEWHRGGGEEGKKMQDPDNPDDQLLAADAFRDAIGPATCKVFFFGQGLQRAELEDQLRQVMAPACFVPVADLVTEFGDDVSDMFLREDAAALLLGDDGDGKGDIASNNNLNTDPAPSCIATAAFDLEHGPKCETVNITMRAAAAPLHLQAVATTARGSKTKLPVNLVGTTVFLDLRPLDGIGILDEIERYYLAGMSIPRCELRDILSRGGGDSPLLPVSRQQQIFEKIVQHPCLAEHPVHPAKRQAFLENLVKIALEGGAAAELYEPLAEAMAGAASSDDGSAFYFRSFRTQSSAGAEASTASLRCTDTFGGVAGTSVKVWPAGIVLGRFLGARDDLCGKRITEFGCGTGAVGVIALKSLGERQGGPGAPSLLPKSYMFTDGTPASVENTRRNIASNDIEKVAFGAAIQACVLDWIDVQGEGHGGGGDDDAGGYMSSDVIVAADVFYDPEVARTFVKCVAVPLLSADAAKSAEAAEAKVVEEEGGEEEEEEGNEMECIIAASERLGTSWQQVLELFDQHGLCYEVLATAPCPLDSPAPVHVLRLALKRRERE
jgi:G3E family GTPase